MNKQEFLQLLELCKLLKSNYVITVGNTIIGTDRSFVYLKKINVGYELPQIAIDMLDIRNKLKEDKKCNVDEISHLNLFDNFIYSNIIGMNNSLLSILSTNAITYPNIHSDEDFIKTTKLKTDQGITYIRRDIYFIPIYNGLLPLVKNDKVDLNIYDHIDGYSFLCNFNIHKKHNLTIEVYLRCIHLR